MANTTRLDSFIVERGLLPTRQVAQAAIMDGGVTVDGKKVTKPGTAIRESSVVEIAAKWTTSKYVSRGAFKLERALQVFQINVENRICLDIGASTGGFTDLLLQQGVQRVYAIDVGYGQLDWKLRQDNRVIVRERTNARHLTPEDLYGEDAEKADLAVADLSFISILKVLPAAMTLLLDKCEFVALIKPQFEVGKGKVGKGGVVRDKATHEEVLTKTLEQAAMLGISALGLTYSPIKGPAGNIEFLVHWTRTEAQITLPDVAQVVNEAHDVLHGATSSE